MIECGVYVISDLFYDDYPDPYLKGNKQENRPHFYALKDDKTGLFWMIPMSGEVEKYEAIIKKRMKAHKPVDFLYVADVGLKKRSAFLIGDMFPLTEEYVSRPYTVNGVPFVVSNKTVAAAVRQRSRRVLNLIRRGFSFSPTQPDVLSIESSLIQKKEEAIPMRPEFEEIRKTLEILKAQIEELENRLNQIASHFDTP